MKTWLKATRSLFVPNFIQLKWPMSNLCQKPTAIPKVESFLNMKKVLVLKSSVNTEWKPNVRQDAPHSNCPQPSFARKLVGNFLMLTKRGSAAKAKSKECGGRLVTSVAFRRMRLGQANLSW